jgi:hypothetical protein
MIARFLRIAALTVLAFTAAPRDVRAQTPIPLPAGYLPVTITLMVPVQVQDLDPRAVKIRVHCKVQPVGTLSVGLNFSHFDFGDTGPVVNGAYSGAAQVVLSGSATQAIPPGQQWTYQCHSEFVTATRVTDGYVMGVPGVTDWAALAPTSGPNLVQGTFTTQ